MQLRADITQAVATTITPRHQQPTS
jgi:hypothetical protein